MLDLQTYNNDLEKAIILSDTPVVDGVNLFLDRDGVVIKDKHHLSEPGKVELELGSYDLFKWLEQNGVNAIIITNQSGISRGLFSWNDYIEVTEKMLEKLNYPKALLAIYANGYSSDSSENTWRKPNPGMFLEAQNKFNLNQKKSLVIGDRLTDIIAGAKAGITEACHVLTGHGQDSRTKVIDAMNQDWLVTYGCMKPAIQLINNVSDTYGSINHLLKK